MDNFDPTFKRPGGKERSLFRSMNFGGSCRRLICPMISLPESRVKLHIDKCDFFHCIFTFLYQDEWFIQPFICRLTYYRVTKVIYEMRSTSGCAKKRPTYCSAFFKCQKVALNKYQNRRRPLKSRWAEQSDASKRD